MNKIVNKKNNMLNKFYIQWRMNRRIIGSILLIIGFYTMHKIACRYHL